MPTAYVLSHDMRYAGDVWTTNNTTCANTAKRSMLSWIRRSRVRQGISPPAGRKQLFLFTKILHEVQNFCEQDKKGTMLPQARLPFIGSNVRFVCQPRKSCYLNQTFGLRTDRVHLIS